MITHLLDTNVCVEYLRHASASNVAAKLAAAPVGSVALCSVVRGELLFGALRSKNPPLVISQVRAFCAVYVSLPFDDRAAEEYAKVRASLAA